MTYEIETADKAVGNSWKSLHKRFGMTLNAKIYDKLKEEWAELQDEDYLTPSWFEEAGDVLYVASQLRAYNEQIVFYDEFKPEKSWAKSIRTAYEDRAFDDLVNILLNMFARHNALSYVYGVIEKNSKKTTDTHVLTPEGLLRKRTLVTPDTAFEGWFYQEYESGVVTWTKKEFEIVLSVDGLTLYKYSEYTKIPVEVIQDVCSVLSSPVMSKFMMLYNAGKDLKEGVLC